MKDKDTINTELAVRVKAIRIHKSMLQHDVATRLGVSTQVVFAIESGLRKMTAARLIQIAEALGVTVGQLVGEQPVDPKLAAETGEATHG